MSRVDTYYVGIPIVVEIAIRSFDQIEPHRRTDEFFSD